MNEQRTATPSTAPVLIMFVLAALAIVQFIAPNLIHPGLTLTLIGVIFLALYFIGWIRESLPLILGWLLAGFGLSFWATSLPPMTALSLPLILIGLGAAFVGMYLTGATDGVLEAQGKRWPLVPGLLLLIVAGTLILEGLVGRERLWGLVVPLIPAISAIWYLVEWRKAAELMQKRA